MESKAVNIMGMTRNTLVPDIKITDLSHARDLLVQNWPSHAISLIDLEIMQDTRAPHHLVVDIQDAGTIQGENFSRHQIKQILSFCSQIRCSDRLLIHCHLGISRSPAVAIGILAAIGLGPCSAVAKVAAIRPSMIANVFIIDMFDKELDLGGKLRQSYEKWQSSH